MEVINMIESEEIIFQIITNSGCGRSNAFDALRSALNNDFEKSQQLILEAKSEILKAHNVQTELLQKESSGESSQVSLLMVHAQDHLMTSMLAKDLIEQMISMQKKISVLERSIKLNK